MRWWEQALIWWAVLSAAIVVTLWWYARGHRRAGAQATVKRRAPVCASRLTCIKCGSSDAETRSHCAHAPCPLVILVPGHGWGYHYD